jgi:hypothetical protein
MDLLGDLLGGGQQRQEMQNFVNRFEQGRPTEGYSGQEALQRYQQVAPNLPAGDYLQAAEQMLSQMTPQQRAELEQYLQQQASQQGVQLPSAQNTPQQPSHSTGGLAQLLTQLHQQQPGLLGQLLGGGSGNGRQGGNGGMGQMLENPVAKMALAGIAAYAAKRAIGRL